MADGPIIIIKKKKAHGHAHHGGAWKVAYADFVTAMMAFFLVLWIINSVSNEEKQAIAQYFSASRAQSDGSGGMLGGLSLESEGVLAGGAVPMPSSTPAPPQERSPAREEGESGGREGGEADAAQASAAEHQERLLEQTEDALRAAMQEFPELDLANQVLLEQRPEGLHIQLIDQEARSMFPPYGVEPNERARRLLEGVGQVLATLPNQIDIAAHTDEPRSGGSPGYSLWELSSDRANAVRRVMMGAGMRDAQIASVIGKADREPLFAHGVRMAGNRRVSITVLKAATVVAPGFRF
jgi:chemotaxis protein MotB